MKRFFSIFMILMIVMAFVMLPLVDSHGALPALAVVTAKQAVSALVISMGLGQLIQAMPSLIDDVIPFLDLSDVKVGLHWLSANESQQIIQASDNVFEVIYNHVINTYFAGNYGVTEINNRPSDWGCLMDWASVPQSVKDWYYGIDEYYKMLIYKSGSTYPYIAVVSSSGNPYLTVPANVQTKISGLAKRTYYYGRSGNPYDSDSSFILSSTGKIIHTGGNCLVGAYEPNNMDFGHSTLPKNYYWDSGTVVTVPSEVWNPRYNSPTGVVFDGWNIQSSGEYAIKIPTKYEEIDGVVTRVVDDDLLTELETVPASDVRVNEKTQTVGLVQPDPIPVNTYDPDFPVTDPVTDPITNVASETWMDRLFHKFVNLFVLPDSYFTDRFNEIRNEVPMLIFPLQIIDDLDSMTRLGPYVLDDVTVNAWGGTHTIIDFQALRDVLPMVHNWVRGVIFILLLFYNYDQVYKLIRGGAYGFGFHVADTASPKLQFGYLGGKVRAAKVRR